MYKAEIELQYEPPSKICSVEMVQINSALTSNPNAGGGLRIFPDKLSRSDTVDRSRVKITARTSLGKRKKIYFRSFDLDDPWENSDIDPNGSDSLDNRGTPQVGTLFGGGAAGLSTWAYTDESGTAFVEFAVTKQPGDNFMIAVSDDSAYLNSSLLQPLDQGLVYGTTPLPNNKANVTPMLTVWRRLHIESESMGPVTGNFDEGLVTEVVADPDPNLTNVSGLVVVSFGAEPLARFGPGAIVVNDTERFDVLKYRRETPPDGATRHIMIVSPPIDPEDYPLLTNRQYIMYDDDDYNGDQPLGGLNGDEGEDLPRANTSWVQTSDVPDLNRFAPAYVIPVYDVGDGNDQVAFRLNLEHSQLTSAYDFDSLLSPEGNRDPNFWTVYLFGAYQGTVLADHDPDLNEEALFGIVDDFRGQGANVFHAVVTLRELIWFGFDPARWQRRTTAHELGHLFDGQHEDGGLMAENSPDDFFTGITIAKIRETVIP